MNEQELQRYQQIDMPFYQNEISPLLPAVILDFHTHLWTNDVWKTTPWQHDVPGGKYMVTTQDYAIDNLLHDGQRMFPEQNFRAVCFGQPTPSADLHKTNDYTAQAAAHPQLYPLIVTGRNLIAASTLEETVLRRGFFGYKVFLNWLGDDYQNITIDDMIGPAEMKLAHQRALIVMLHVPRAQRLVDPEIQKGVERLAKDYPHARIVLAHCGRCYLPDEAQRAMHAIRNLENVYLDTAMVMDPTVLEIVLDHIGPGRLLFATDLPVANMRGRRVYVMDHWVDVVLDGYPPSNFRIASNNMHATFMVYEIILAVARAARRIGLDQQHLHNIFHDNGMSLLTRVQK